MKLPDLNKSEYEVLKVIWKQENSSVREVHDRVKSSTTWAYTTTKTHMDRMVKRGLLQRSERDNVFVYQSLVSKPEGIAKMVQYFADRVLEVNYSSLISMFSKSEALSDEEIKKLNSILENEDD
ncbi:BlaI/MecI/CopY family transcriptional regulator [Paremcibacter congregatus]|uniref:BlaI/MecI/CopY family transcriptional regulator n=1 Tax=Paremcibacter congregatus TaxID=2043170 RepID=UPI003A8CF654